jgi:hypothetical protein
MSIPIQRLPGSTMIHGTGHDAEKNVMAVRFHDGTTLHYSGVSAAQHLALRAADSSGRFLHKHIIPHHPSKKA